MIWPEGHQAQGSGQLLSSLAVHSSALVLSAEPLPFPAPWVAREALRSGCV